MTQLPPYATSVYASANATETSGSSATTSVRAGSHPRLFAERFSCVCVPSSRQLLPENARYADLIIHDSPGTPRASGIEPR